MPTVKARPMTPTDRQQREYDRLRHGRVAPETIRAIQKRQGPARTASATPPSPTFLEGIYGRRAPERLTAPGPAYLPHLIALEQLQARSAAAPVAARPAATPRVAAPAPRSAQPEPEMDGLLPRGLLGW